MFRVFALCGVCYYLLLYTLENLRAADFWSSAARRLPAFSGSPMHYSDQSIHERKDIRPCGSVCTLLLYRVREYVRVLCTRLRIMCTVFVDIFVTFVDLREWTATSSILILLRLFGKLMNINDDYQVKKKYID